MAAAKASDQSFENELKRSLRVWDILYWDLGKIWGKIRMADHLRMMQDNQRLLNTSVADDRALREQRHRFREGRMEKFTGQKAIEFPRDEMGDISIDSPVTTNHNYPPPPKGNGGALMPWVLAAAMAGGIGTYLLTKPSPAPAPQTGWKLELIEPKEKK